MGLETRADIETMKNVVDWLALHDFLSLLSYTIHAHLPRASTTHSELALLHQLCNQENALQT